MRRSIGTVRGEKIIGVGAAIVRLRRALDEAERELDAALAADESPAVATLVPHSVAALAPTPPMSTED
jgi:hypothetical protein